jgi:hypothetical protein
MLAALSLGCAALLASSALIGTAVARASTALDTTSALSVLRLDSVDPRGQGKPLTAAQVERIRHLPGVEDVRPYAQLGTTMVGTDELATGVLWATPRVPWIQPQLIRSVSIAAVGQEPAATEIYLPDSVSGVDNRPLLGKHVRIQYTRATGPATGEAAELSVRVAGLFDNSHPGADGESATYVSDVLFQRLLKAQLGLSEQSPLPAGYGYPSVYVKASSVGRVARVEDQLVALGFHPDSPAARAKELPSVLRLASKANTVLGALLLTFGLGIGISLGSTWSSMRRWDTGVLTSLGWSRTRIMRNYLAELTAVGVSVALASVTLGCAVSLLVGELAAGHSFLGASFAGRAALPDFGWLACVSVGVPMALMLGSTPRVLRLASLPPDLALRRGD